MTDLAHQAASLLGAEAAGAQPLQGGDLSEVMRVRLADGRAVVAKTGPTARREAAMLRAIADTGAPAPEVLAVSDALLVLEDLGPDQGPGAAWTDLGRALRQLHAATGDAWGWPEDHAFGAVPIPNGPADSWPRFWAERRLLPSCAALPAELARRVEALAGRLDDLLPKTPPRALLHGDLWTGNVMARDGRVTGLIDPACYYGDAEVDLAMLVLFGRPAPSFWQAYGPLAEGVEQRRPIYQLWPALVHFRLFGEGYRGLVGACLASAGV